MSKESKIYQRIIPLVSAAEADFLIQKENESSATQKMEKYWNEEIKPVWDGFFDDEGWVKPFDDYQEGKGLALIGKQVNLDEEAKSLFKNPRELWEEFYFWKINGYVETRIGKEGDLIRELKLAESDLSLSDEDKDKIKTLSSDDYIDLGNKIGELQREVGFQRYRQGLDCGSVVELGVDIPKMEDNLSPKKTNDVYVVKVLDKNKMREYWNNIVTIHDVIDELNEKYKLDKEEIFNVLNEELSQKNIFDKDNEEVNSLFKKGREILKIVENIKENELIIENKISNDLAKLIEESKTKKVEKIINLLEMVHGKQIERKESFKKSIDLKLKLELSKNELDELEDDEELKSGEKKIIITEKLSELEKQIEETIKKRDGRKFLEITLKKEDDKKLIGLNKTKEELEKIISFDQTGNFLTENERKKIIRKNQLTKEIIPELEKQKKYLKY